MRTIIFTLIVAGAVSGVSCIAHATDEVPNFDIVKSCKSETADSVGVGESLASCIDDENQAKKELTERWSRYAREDKQTCLRETTIAGDPTYVELETCLEMAAAVRIPAKGKP
jgi:hypothetical protein